MELWVLDKDFQNKYVIDDFISVIWTESYIGAGEFELYLGINDYTIEISNFIRENRKKDIDTFCWTAESDQVMIFEKVEISTEIIGGGRMIFSGKSLESLLNRRIVWRQTRVTTDLQNAVMRLFNDNIEKPKEAERKIPNFTFEITADPSIVFAKVDKQFTGDNLYDAIYELCDLHKIGFRVTLEPNTKNLHFQLYAGVDRSYEQTKNPYVIFSPKFDNLVSSNLLEEIEEYKNVTLVSGEDEGHERRTLTIGNASGYARRELFTDAGDIQSEIYDDEGNMTQVPDDEYFAELMQRGNEKLEEWKKVTIFESEVEPINTFVYGRDFYKGDIVQVETNYGVYSKMRVMQMVRSEDESGKRSYPNFEIIEDEGGD